MIRTTLVGATTMVLALAAPRPALAQASAAADRPAAVNAACPISKDPIDGKTFVEHDGSTVGFCCPGCVRPFEAWSNERKAAFVLASVKSGRPAAPTTQPAEAPAAKGDPYLLDTCPVSGEKLGSMGDPVVKVIDGREVRFCCGGCVGRLEADPVRYFKRIDEAIARQQQPFYPIDTCVVTGEPLYEQGEYVGVDHVHRNRLVRLCCPGCVRKFEANPARYLEKLDAAVIKAQRTDYPLPDCIVRKGSRLGSMGDPVQIVVANRLVQFCCAGCQPPFDEDPAPFIARLDKAWKKKGS